MIVEIGAAAERELVQQGMPLVDQVARRIARRLGPRVELDELRSIGRSALVEVARSYDPARSAFAGYASFKLKCAMFDEVRKATRGRGDAARLKAVIASERLLDEIDTEPPPDGPLPTEEDWQERMQGMLEDQAGALAMGFMLGGGEGPPDGSETPEEQLAQAEASALARRAIEALPEQERQIVERYFDAEESFETIAAELGIHKSWACRTLKKALATLRERLDKPRRRGR
ncbi:MAG: sigma-70 family RNA polymerase sigma factor [Byssovorax sp.]